MSTDEDTLQELIMERCKKEICSMYTNGTKDRRHAIEYNMKCIKDDIESWEKGGVTSKFGLSDPRFLKAYKKLIAHLEETINQVRQQESSTIERV